MAIIPSHHVGPSKPKPTARESAKKRIVSSYRRKILRLFPRAQFDEKIILGCSADEFMEEIQKQFTGEMTWENYSTVWFIANYEKPDAEYLKANPEAFYSHFNYNSFGPQLISQMYGRLGNLYRKEKPQGVSLTPGQPSKFDVAPGQTPSFEPGTEPKVEGTDFKQEFEEEG